MRREIAAQNDVFALSRRVTARVLYPVAGFKAKAADDQALVVQLVIDGKYRVLLVSDSGLGPEKALLACCLTTKCERYPDQGPALLREFRLSRISGCGATATDRRHLAGLSPPAKESPTIGRAGCGSAASRSSARTKPARSNWSSSAIAGARPAFSITQPSATGAGKWARLARENVFQKSLGETIRPSPLPRQKRSRRATRGLMRNNPPGRSRSARIRQARAGDAPRSQNPSSRCAAVDAAFFGHGSGNKRCATAVEPGGSKYSTA